MASGFFAILDDIAGLMDDVALTTKVATGKTAGILGDDLAVNAEKATGYLSSRELPVLWSITKGSFLNKIIIIPVAILLNVFLPVAIKVILVLGGFYLAYEGVEKIVAFLFHRSKHGKETSGANESNEKEKVKSAIRTDFILSLEIVIISLGTVLDKALPVQIFTVTIVAILATIGVYGIVAVIVRMDDAGRQLIQQFKNKGFFSAVGRLLIVALPFIIKILGVVGTLALILVSGGIFIHNIEFLHNLLPQFPLIIRELLFGLVGGLLTIGITTSGRKVFSLLKSFTKRLSLLLGLVYLVSCTVPDKASLQVMNETRKQRKSPLMVKAYRSGKLTRDKLELRINNSFSYESNVTGTQKLVFYAGTFTKNGDTLALKFQDNYKDSLWTGNAIMDTANNKITILASNSAYNKEMIIVRSKKQ